MAAGTEWVAAQRLDGEGNPIKEKDKRRLVVKAEGILGLKDACRTARKGAK